jgi:hypothetical protein
VYQTAPINSAVNSTQHQTSSQGQDAVLKSIRDTALTHYQRYQTQIGQVEREFNIAMKKTGRNATKGVSRLGDTLSSLNVEMTQLNNQYAAYSQKLDLIAQRQRDLATSGILNVISPVKADFNSFDEEFGQALTNIDLLIRNWSSKAGTVKTDYLSLKPLAQRLNGLNSSLEGLSGTSRQNSQNLFSAHEELTQTASEVRGALSQQIQDRIRQFQSQIHNVEQRSLAAFQQSQAIIDACLVSQFELRQSFSQTVYRAEARVRSELRLVRKRMRDLSSLRSIQMQGIRDRITGMQMEVARNRRKRLKASLASGIDDPQESPIATELEAMRVKIQELERIVAEKKPPPKPKPKSKSKQKPKPTSERKPKPAVKPAVRSFMKVEEDGTVQLILVDADGNVYF